MEQRASEYLRDKAVAIIQCGQYEVIGEAESLLDENGLQYWSVSHARGFRRVGEAIKIETMPGTDVEVYPATMPCMVTWLEPGEEGHKQLLKSYEAIEQRERVKAAGIELPDVGRKGAGV